MGVKPRKIDFTTEVQNPNAYAKVHGKKYIPVLDVTDEQRLLFVSAIGWFVVWRWLRPAQLAEAQAQNHNLIERVEGLVSPDRNTPLTINPIGEFKLGGFHGAMSYYPFFYTLDDIRAATDIREGNTFGTGYDHPPSYWLERCTTVQQFIKTFCPEGLVFPDPDHNGIGKKLSRYTGVTKGVKWG